MQNELKSRKPLDLEAESRLSPGSQGEDCAKQRARAKSSDSRVLARTNSDPDLRARGRSRSYIAQCSRSRSQTKAQLSVEELLMATEKPRKCSIGKRPNPDGMASGTESVNQEGNGGAGMTGTSDSPLSEDGNDSIEESIQVHAKTATEVLEKRRLQQRQREAAYLNLRKELERAHQELRKRDEECKKLSSVRDDLDKEVEDLTASLFEEAHKMVTDAKVKQAAAEMQLKEAKMKMDGLEAEVTALKILVITSTPANPGKKGHRRAPSADQICSDCETYHCETDGPRHKEDGWVIEGNEEKEVDRIAHREFVSWLEKRCPTSDHPFLESIEKYDVIPCLEFLNQELSAEIFAAIKENALIVEPVSTSNRSRRCALSKASILCSFRIKAGENSKWHFISNSCRSRIITVADLYTFLRYIRQGLIRKEVNAMYWDLMQKRGQISLARLGLVKNIE